MHVIDRFDSIARFFLNVVNKHGFPSQKQLGGWKSDTAIQLGSGYDIVLLHAYEGASWQLVQQIHQLVLKNYYSGMISPAQLKLWMENSLNFGIPGRDRFRIAVDSCNIYLQKMPAGITAGVTRARQALELQSLEGYERIVTYKIKNPEQPFILNYEYTDYRNNPAGRGHAGLDQMYEPIERLRAGCK